MRGIHQLSEKVSFPRTLIHGVRKECLWRISGIEAVINFRLVVGAITPPKRRELLAGQCHIHANVNLAETRTASISGSLQVIPPSMQLTLGFFIVL